MEEKKSSLEVQRRSFIYVLVCVTGILAFALATIYPSYRKMARLDNAVADLEARVGEQRILFPFYQKLRKGLESEASKGQSSPTKSGLSIRRLDDLSPIFGEMAADCGLQTFEVTPDVKSLANDSRFLSVDLSLKGKLLDLRKFLLELADLAYLEDIKELQIQEGSGGKEYFLKILLRVDNARAASG